MFNLHTIMFSIINQNEQLESEMLLAMCIDDYSPMIFENNYFYTAKYLISTKDEIFSMFLSSTQWTEINIGALYLNM